jgi:hypothetical protein
LDGAKTTLSVQSSESSISISTPVETKITDTLFSFTIWVTVVAKLTDTLKILRNQVVSEPMGEMVAADFVTDVTDVFLAGTKI